uniref:Regulatory protein zeste n=1 Tax=Cacopsylla melanoneura TaxID=428564 RepID=A0A8D9A724_9HEMI
MSRSMITSKEHEDLVSLILQKQHILENKQTDRYSKAEKAAAWDWVEEEFNRNPNNVRVSPLRPLFFFSFLLLGVDIRALSVDISVLIVDLSVGTYLMYLLSVIVLNLRKTGVQMYSQFFNGKHRFRVVQVVFFQ